MAHFLEEAERQQKKSRRNSLSQKKKIEDKKRLIRENYEANKEAYEGFITTIYELIERVNTLPEEMREPFRKLKASSKNTKLDNKLHFFSSSKREKKFSFFSLSLFKPAHFKHIRVFFVYVNKEPGLVSFEFKESNLERKRISSSSQDKEEPKKKPSHNKGRVHVIFHYPISKLDKNTGNQIIDWLVFRDQLEELPMWAEVPIEEKHFF